MDFDFVESGSGPALLFLPGSYSNCSAWNGVRKALGGSYRTISTSLPGYGGSKEVRKDTVSDVRDMTRFVERVIQHAGQPVHLVGHSYGGLIALATALAGKADLLSLITFEGNPIYTRQKSGEFRWKKSVEAMQKRFEQAFAAGDPEAAGIIIDFWSREGNFKSMPPAFREYCQTNVSTNILDWRTAIGLRPHFEDFSTIKIPTTLIRSENANQPIIDITEGIYAHVLGCNQKIVRNSDHFLTSTHPKECAAIIDQHMQSFSKTAT